MNRRHTLGAVAALLTSAVAPHAAQAQEAAGIALNQYQHPLAGDALMAVPSPWVGGHLMPRGMITFDYAKDPLVLVDEEADQEVAPVTGQAFLHLGASFAMWNRLMVAVDLPVAVAQSGDQNTIGGVTLAAAESAAAGDLRLGLRGRLWGEYYEPFQVGVGAYIFVPTGPSDGYTGDGSVYGHPHLLLGGRLSHMVWSATAGSILRGADNNPHTLTFGVGGGALLLDEMLQVGPEFFGAVALEDKALYENGTTIDRKGAVNAEVHLSAKLRLAKVLYIGAAGGPGVSDGVGTPAFRVLAQFGFDPKPERTKKKPPPRDSDGDGIVDPQDACPDVPGIAHEDPSKHGCPSDRDGDGIIDTEDACPDVPGPKSEDPAKNGCPPPGDRDNDGILDPEDACPDVPGVKSDDPAKNGCPPDRDGDGIIDSLDACPDEPGPKSEDPKKNGCPVVIVTQGEILILQKVEFDFDKSTIKPVSDPLLDQVAKTLNDHPEITLVQVQGHTDNKGAAFYNLKLSDDRAKAVREALIKRGVDAKRLQAKGYGQSKPIADNKTEEGRSTNRRVEFKILKRDTK